MFLIKTYEHSASVLEAPIKVLASSHPYPTVASLVQVGQGNIALPLFFETFSAQDMETRRDVSEELVLYP